MPFEIIIDIIHKRDKLFTDANNIVLFVASRFAPSYAQIPAALEADSVNARDTYLTVFYALT